MTGNEWAAEESLKWLRGRNPEALDREIEKIKKEIAIRKRERNSITMLLDPQVNHFHYSNFLLNLFLGVKTICHLHVYDVFPPNVWVQCDGILLCNNF